MGTNKNPCFILPNLNVSQFSGSIRLLDSNRRNCEAIMNWFNNDLSIHGVIVVSRHTSYAKFLSFIYFCVCIGFCFWQMGRVVQNFLKFDTKTSVSVLEFESIGLPAITICPATVFLRSAAEKQTSLYTGTYFPFSASNS